MQHPDERNNVQRLDTSSQEVVNEQILEALFLTPARATTARRYHYNLRAAQHEKGKCLSALSDRARNDGSTAPTLPEHLIKALALQYEKVSETAACHAKRDLTISDHNAELCKPCRRIFDGNGSFALPVTKVEKGVHYSHWDVNLLKRSAQRCPLCLLIHRGLATPLMPLAVKDVIPAHYDIVGFPNDKEVYAIRVLFYGLSLKNTRLLPKITDEVRITMMAVEPSHLPEDLRKLKDRSTTTISPGHCSMLMNWLNKCDTSHACLRDSGRLEQGRSSLPTRLIDVGNYPHASPVRLVLSQDLSPSFRYLTLSHSWGSSEVAMTVQLTMKNKSSFMTSIEVEKLPRTFADTILLARHLDVRYLWIDSLCIVQDDEMDWKTEAAKMAEVYANAYVNVAATASSNSSQGLFKDRNPMTTKRCVATVREGHSLIPAGTYQCFNAREWISQISRAPLSKRAWVYQEWLLSPRILHFANDQIFWECREMHASEAFQDHIPARYEFGLRRFDLESSKEVTKRKFLEIWDTIVQEYTTRDLTYVSDKLTALSGLARTLHRRHPEAGKYVGGMWAKYLIDQLAWSASCKAHRSNIYRAPSWSWASMDGSISPNFNWRLVSRDHRNRACRSPVTILSIDASLTDDLFDWMIKATLKVEAPLLKITIEAGEGATEDEDDHKNREPIQMMNNTVAGTLSNETERPRPFGDRDFRLLLSAKNHPFFMREGSRGRLDDDRDISAEPELYFMPLLIYNDKLPRFGDEEWPVVDEIIGLVLEPTGAMEGQYKRCGTCTVEEADIELLLCDLGNQRPDEVAYEQWKPGDIGLDDMFPPDYVYDGLSKVLQLPIPFIACAKMVAEVVKIAGSISVAIWYQINGLLTVLDYLSEVFRLTISFITCAETVAEIATAASFIGVRIWSDDRLGNLTATSTQIAEVVGLAIGAVNLAALALFTTCVECLDYISFGRNHGRDYELSMTKLILPKARLIAWGQSLQVTDGGRENTALRDHWSAEGEMVERCLTSIKMMFEEADQTESRYGLKPLSAHSGSISLPQEQRSNNAFSRVETVLRSRVVQRQEGVSMLQKTRWAICDKKKFDSMIVDLTLLIEGLIDLSERLQALELQQRLLRVEVQAIMDVDSIRLMEEASGQLQAPARSQITERESDRRDTSGHTYINTIIKD